MCKRRILAGFLAAVMLLGTMPAAAAAVESTTSGITLDKTATALNSNWETNVTLSVTAPSANANKPTAVEFVLDATESMFKTADTGKTVIAAWADAIKAQLQDNKNVYVGVTVFGSEAKEIQTPTLLTSGSSLNLDSMEHVRWLKDHTGTNVQAGIRTGMKALNGLDTKTVPVENRYLVLVTDGGSFWRLDANGRAINDTTATGAALQNNDAAELVLSGKSLKSGGTFAALTNVDIASVQYKASTLADALTEIQNTGAYTNFEKGVYAASQELGTIKNAKLMTVGYPYYGGDTALHQLTTLAKGLVDTAGGNSVYYRYVDGGVGSMDFNTIAKEIAGQITTAVRAGSTITDQIGAGTDNLKASYNFDLVTNQDITLTINGDTSVGTRNGNTWTFFGNESKLVYTPGTVEQFVLTLGRDVKPGQKLTLTYTAKLTNPSSADGRHTVSPNVKAWLTPANTDSEIAFPQPELSYRVGGGGGGSSVLNTDDHYSYIIGYKDGYLRPYGTITRGEVATIFFRLLTDEARDKYWSQTNNYSDCNSDLWCNNAISTLSNMGIIDGYSDGTFRPYGKITRAQFAKIAVGFFETTTQEYQGYYSDIPENAWFTNYVEAASRVGLIQGFADGTFRPNVNITRAQACVIVNRALNRKPATERLLPTAKMINWPDCTPSDWYYADMQEATNSHDYSWLASGGDAKAMEKWTAKLPQRDWAAFEHAWSTAHSAPGGEVIK
ncbi:S-layer homology domain-containing protein [uncultured Dysosmobacter sp.]|mgnify:CR=1 FL=1|uniref:S-layer homology domain-containing protein n=1 Tax=uncultured Dysosmobacter sp. TaxID=2591384 RepID=UPI0026726800|nr:S-layer homology domain-containing protein [uncultured Dysosmobacter sp.]